MADATGAAAPERLNARRWERFLQGPDGDLVDRLYVPALSAATQYDRCCAYFSSSVLAVAARGFGAMVARLQASPPPPGTAPIRLLVNEAMTPDDVRALADNRHVARLEQFLMERFRTPTDALARARFATLAWLVKRGWLEIRVGVMRHGEGILHDKFGIATDGAGDRLTFAGSANETASGLTANFESLEVSTSWDDPDRDHEFRTRFETMWRDEHPSVHVVALPEALVQHLVKLAPEEAPTGEPRDSLARRRAAMAWRFIAAAPYLPNGAQTVDATGPVQLWPHQRRVVADVAGAWPAGRLLCDEVGMGKTIEAIAAMRRLLAGRGAKRVLILLPAGLVRQWQAELREKGGLAFPRYDASGTLVWPNGDEQRNVAFVDALKTPHLLLSRELARSEANLPLILGAMPWDLVVLDEAHAARRAKQEEGAYNGATRLLGLARQLQLRGVARGMMLLSATPMQVSPWEPWDLLSVLGEGGAWLGDFGAVRDFYVGLAALRRGTLAPPDARPLAAMVVDDPDFPPPPTSIAQPLRNDRTGRIDHLSELMAYATPTDRHLLADWMRDGAPLARRMHRNTRDTLRDYYRQGMLASPPPTRDVRDARFRFAHADERAAYDAIDEYMDERFRALEHEQRGKGFVITIYRRRAASSPHALRLSLGRRLDALDRAAQDHAFSDLMDQDDAPEDLAALDLPDDFDRGAPIGLPRARADAAAERIEIDRLVRLLNDLGGKDTKRDQLVEELSRIADDGRPVLVFTEYVDTMLYLRDFLVTAIGDGLGCYSGAGGALRADDTWHEATKEQVRAALDAGRLRVLLCTDAASEGLNLQSAGAVINYDLPWNPARVEQRIGRVDRIGQRLARVRVTNLLLEGSVDDQVYSALRARCRMFETFVGSMQPVLARASRMLRGELPISPDDLSAVATTVDADEVVNAMFRRSGAVAITDTPSPLDLTSLRDELGNVADLSDESVRVTVAADGALCTVTIGDDQATIALTPEGAELDRTSMPLTAPMPLWERVAAALSPHGDRAPLVVATVTRGAFSAAEAMWIDEDGGMTPIESLGSLRERLDAWEGHVPPLAATAIATAQAHGTAQRRVDEMRENSMTREISGLHAQIEAARYRLQVEVGKVLAWMGAPLTPGGLNRALFSGTQGAHASAALLKEAYQRFDGYPTWTPELVERLRGFEEELTPNDRRAMQALSELTAALQDPRWVAASTLKRADEAFVTGHLLAWYEKNDNLLGFYESLVDAYASRGQTVSAAAARQRVSVVLQRRLERTIEERRESIRDALASTAMHLNGDPLTAVERAAVSFVIEVVGTMPWRTVLARTHDLLSTLHPQLDAPWDALSTVGEGITGALAKLDSTYRLRNGRSLWAAQV
jgi:superfamily II DNA or RNA helicase